MTKLLVSLILGFSSLASAATVDIRSANAKSMVVDKDRGGGNAVNGQLFDFYENEGTQTVDVTKLAAYTEVLVPLFTKLDAKIPALSAYLKESLTDKDWYLEPKPLSAAGCVNSSMIKVQTTIIACQSPYEVRIDSNWLQSQTTTREQAAGLIMHELLVAKMMQTPDFPGGQIQEESVRYMNRLFFSLELPDALKLQKTLHERNFEFLPTAVEIAKVKALIKRDLLTLCPTTNGHVKYLAALNYSDTFVSKARDDRYSMGEADVLLRLGVYLKSELPFTGADYDVSCASLHKTVRDLPDSI